MIKNLRFLFLSVLMMLTGIVMADEISSNFTAKDLTVAEGELGWTASIDANSYETNGSARGVQFGAAKGTITLTSAATFTGVTKVTMLVSTNDTGNSISVKVGESALGEKIDLPKENNVEKIFEGTAVDGTIVITIEDNSKSVYIKSIKVTYAIMEGGDVTPDPIPEPEPVPADTLTVANALTMLQNMAANVKTENQYVKGIISKIESVDTGNYGNATFYISDNGQEEGQFMIFRCYDLDNKKFTDANAIKVGDVVVVYGMLVNYRSTKAAETDPVTPEMTNPCYIYSQNGLTEREQAPVELTTAASVKDFLALTAGTEATLTLTNAQVTYVNVNNNKTDLFIREGDAAIDFFDLGIEAKVGDILNGTINVKLGANSGFVAAVKGTNELNSTVQVTGSAEVLPLEFTDFTEAADYYCHLLIAKNVTVNDNGNILDGEKTILTIYDRFKNGLQDKLKKHKDDGKTFNVTGLMYDGGTTYGPEFVIVDATYADGSEITDKPIELIGNGTKDNPYLISDLLQLNTTILDQYKDSVWVKGVIVGSINGSKQNAIVDSIASNLALADETGITEFAKVIPVELKANSIFRTNLNVKDNATNIGKEIMLFGLIQSYFSTVGIKGISDYILDGVQYSLNVTELKTQNRYNGAIYNLRGQRIITPGKGLYIKDGKKYFVK